MNDPRYFELQADDPARAAAFYRAIFGWEIVRDKAIPIEFHRSS
jgi:predicted enzyme related to lactoylglutathione lyase